MRKESMTSRQAISVIVLFIFGSTIILGLNTEPKQDSWISLIIGIILSLPLVLMYARIIKLFPGESLYNITEKLLGKVGGTIINIMITWYAIHLGSLVLRNFSEYAEISILLHTPQIIVMISIIFIAVYTAKMNIEILGKWGIFVLPIILIMVIITLILSIGDYNINNLFPIMEHSFKKVFDGGFKILAFPLAETVLILPLADFFKKTDSSYKIYISSLIIAGFTLLIIIFRNLLILGTPLMTLSYFPTFTAARIIELGEFLSRIEGVITINFVLAEITKVTICLIVGAKGMAKLFNIKNYKNLALPVGLLIITLSLTQFSNVFQMFDFIKIYHIYAFPFQIIIPMIIWVVGEIKTKNNKVVT